MADNYLEKKMEDFHARIAAKKAKEDRARQLAYKKRMAAYRKKLEADAALQIDATLQVDTARCDDAAVPSAESHPATSTCI